MNNDERRSASHKTGKKTIKKLPFAAYYKIILHYYKIYGEKPLTICGKKAVDKTITSKFCKILTGIFLKFLRDFTKFKDFKNCKMA